MSLLSIMGKGNKIILVPKFVFLYLFLHCVNFGSAAKGRNGKWQLLLNNTGVVAMHMALTHHNTVIMYDQTGNGPSSYRLGRRFNGTRCSRSGNDLFDSTCYAHSIEYHVSTNRVRPLRTDTDVWCSSGAFLSNGTLVQTGGYKDGSKRVRYIEPCTNQKCDWEESSTLLSDDRWYASNQILPEDDRVIVVGGKKVFSYEFLPKLSSHPESYAFPFLRHTYDGNDGGLNLYPFLHLSSDGNLFVFANRDSILFDYRENKVVKTFPRIPGGGARNYPNTGSSVILPLHHRDRFDKVEVMVCGGGASGAFRSAKGRRYVKGLRSCGRIVITGNRHKWVMENMSDSRLLNDMLILPTGHVLIINGAKRGCGGYDNAVSPSLEPYLYNPDGKQGKRFSVLESTEIARMYHSSAILLPDGRVLVGGGNPHSRYTYENVKYPTELRLQAFVPHYMDKKFDHRRPHNVSIYARRGNEEIGYSEDFNILFRVGRRLDNDDVVISAYAPPFTTHSISMNQRMLVLKIKSLVRAEGGKVKALVEAPPSPNVAPPGYYLFTVVNGGIPSVSHWVRFMQV